MKWNIVKVFKRQPSIFWIVVLIMYLVLIAVFIPESSYLDSSDNYYLNKAINVFGFALVIWLLLTFLTFLASLAIGLPVVIGLAIWEWLKKRRAKSTAYYLIGNYQRYNAEQFEKRMEEIMPGLAHPYYTFGDGDESRHLKEDLHWILQEKREDEDEGSLLKAMSDSDLLALKKQFKSIKRVVKIIDDILEERE
ncbi:MAG TPA: hypothetical protein VI728_03565 [Syntrophales bacterium]|nr:MAG: hypothetical protein A2Z28_05540 [Chloroflexi bacterium RBG_16_51_9]HLE17345.1 hypothetical protein [Syntrophales bacterium]